MSALSNSGRMLSNTGKGSIGAHLQKDKGAVSDAHVAENRVFINKLRATDDEALLSVNDSGVGSNQIPHVTYSVGCGDEDRDGALVRAT